VSIGGNERPQPDLEGVGQVLHHNRDSGQMELLINQDDLSQAIRALARYKIGHIETRSPGLEEAFVYYTGETLRDDIGVSKTLSA